jgi:hypothetical protein
MNEHQTLLNDLMMAPQFRAALGAALAGQLGYLAEQLRYHARNGETVKAAWVEGNIVALESTLVLLERYVKKAETAGTR